MDDYYVNDEAEKTGEHEVHKAGCDHMPKDKTGLGSFTNCKEAVEKAQTIYSNVDGCYFCCRPCHTR